MSTAHDEAPPEEEGTRSEGRHRPNDSGGAITARGAVWVFLREIVIVVVLALALSFVAKTWLVQSFWIPSDSMNNTLVRADRVVVSKLTPGPFDLKRGDIVVFTDPGHWLRNSPAATTSSSAVSKALSWVGLLPNDEGNHLIKRVIGLPGDTVSCCSSDGKLRVNGVAISEPYLYPGDDPSDIVFAITVPAGKIWVMGDHRSDSSDSRYNDILGAEAGTDPKDNTGLYGSVPIDNVVGSAFSIVWPLNRATWLGNPSDTFTSVPAAGASATTPTSKASVKAPSKASVKTSVTATASAAPPAGGTG